MDSHFLMREGMAAVPLLSGFCCMCVGVYIHVCSIVMWCACSIVPTRDSRAAAAAAVRANQVTNTCVHMCIGVNMCEVM